MCGIAGYFDRRAGTSEDRLRAIGQAMADTIRHRGPDGEGVWVDAASGIALTQRRLAIIDLSPMGAQPMVSGSGRYVMTYNGEVFNFTEMRAELEAKGIRFRGHSDTEVMLEGIGVWGLEPTIKRLIGMFAIALWDRETRTLYLIRDRVGIKPLYYSCDDAHLAFGSELKVFRETPGWAPTLNRDAMAGYLRHNYIQAPNTIWREVKKLPQGHILTLAPGKEPVLTQFWSMRRVALDGLAAAERGGMPDAEAIDRLDALLRDSVKRRMIADVPLGAFLSGGIDSSTVVALMQAQSNRPVKTFSIGFRESGYDEADHAKAVAKHLGTDHTEFYVEPAHALDVIPRLPEWYDEPFADASQIPTYLVSEMTRKHVTVALSGDGGDEFFAGYSRYFGVESMWRNVASMPRPLRSIGASAIRAVPQGAWDTMLGLLPARWQVTRPGEKAHKFASILEEDDIGPVYRRIVSQWDRPNELAIDAQEPLGPMWDETIAGEIPGYIQRMQFLDAVTYLTDDILTKVDRATMAVALEGRVPLLDHRVIEFSWTVPMAQKIRNGKGKWLLRQVLDRYVPQSLVDRPKMGFGVPIDSWLRGPLRDWANELLNPAKLAADGLLRPEPIAAAWKQHLDGTRDWQYPLWTVLMFQAWRQRWA